MAQDSQLKTMDMTILPIKCQGYLLFAAEELCIWLCVLLAFEGPCSARDQLCVR